MANLPHEYCNPTCGSLEPATACDCPFAIFCSIHFLNCVSVSFLSSWGLLTSLFPCSLICCWLLESQISIIVIGLSQFLLRL